MRSAIARRCWRLLAVFAIALAVLDRAFPPPVPGPDARSALVVVARDGTPLRAFPGREHVWRHPVALDDVSPLYLEALVAYEDRDLLVASGRQSSRARAGGVAMGPRRPHRVRRLHAHHAGGAHHRARAAYACRANCDRSLRALQLELHYSKREILTLYVNHAPMGGVLEGVEAASRGYLGKSSRRLTHAEAALLAVLPQTPSRLRPDRYAAARARRARQGAAADGRRDGAPRRSPMR